MKRKQSGTEQPTTNVAVFGDVHGRVLLPFYLCGRWQEEHGEPIHLALSVGDLGIYRSYYHMEKTSQRWARKHPEELGFSKFFHNLDLATQKLVQHPMADAALGTTDAHLYFVPGNHEDHNYLGELWQSYARSLGEPVTVDRAWQGLAEGRYAEDEFAGYGRIHALPEGPVIELPGVLDEQTWEPRHTLPVYAVNGLEKHTMRSAWSGTPEPIDVLLSHETYKGRLKGFDRTRRRDEYGSAPLLDLIRAQGPAYHFFGHHHWYYPEIELANYRGGSTRSVGLNQLYFESHESTITRGCFGVLRLAGPGELSFEIVEDPWFQALRYPDCAAYM